MKTKHDVVDLFGRHNAKVLRNVQPVQKADTKEQWNFVSSDFEIMAAKNLPRLSDCYNSNESQKTISCYSPVLVHYMSNFSSAMPASEEPTDLSFKTNSKS